MKIRLDITTTLLHYQVYNNDNGYRMGTISLNLPHPSVQWCPIPSVIFVSGQAFRYLVRRHGCDLSYTQMLHSGMFAPDNAREFIQVTTAVQQ